MSQRIKPDSVKQLKAVKARCDVWSPLWPCAFRCLRYATLRIPQHQSGSDARCSLHHNLDSTVQSSLGASVYISPLGKDAGECDDSSTACRTLAYAVKHAKDEDNIRVMPG